MRIAIPKEIKNHEYRVALTPASVEKLVSGGHSVFVQQSAGLAVGFSDNDYTQAGAHVLPTAADVWKHGDLIVKVKEPQPEEYAYLDKNKILFCYLHLAANPVLTHTLLHSGVTAISFETIQLSDGSLPLLKPMSAIAGRLAVQMGAQYLTSAYGGRGVLLSGSPGVERGHILIIGAGVVGCNALEIALGMGANVSIMDCVATKLEWIEGHYKGRVRTLFSTPDNIVNEVAGADLVVGAVLLPGAQAPKILTHSMLSLMRRGSVLVDVAIDQGGCFESSRVTTHADPVYQEHGITHYCVANMPSLAAYTATLALDHAIQAYVEKITQMQSVDELIVQDEALFKGLNIYQGNITHLGVAQSLQLPCSALV